MAAPSSIDKAMIPQSPFLTEDQEEPIEIVIGDENAPTEFEIAYEHEKEPSFDANLADYMDESELHSLASDLLTDFDHDKNSRKEWEKT